MAKIAWKRVAPGIYQRGEMQYQVKIARKGRNIVETFDSLDEAKKFWLQKTTEIEGGVYVDPKRERETTLIDLLDKYEREVTPTKKGHKQEASVLRMWRSQEWASLPISSISARHIVAWRNGRVAEGKAPTTVSNAMNTLSAVFSQAISDWQYNVTNPVLGLKRPKMNPPRLVKMPASDRDKLLDACRRGPPWLRLMVGIAIETAMRQGEIRRIRWEHVYDTHIHLPKTKNGDLRDVPLTEEALRVVNEIRATLPRHPDGWMFGDPDAKSWEGGFTTDMIQNAYRDAVAWAMKQPDGLSQKYTFHDLRHVAITELKKDHVDAMDLAKTTGHKTVNLLHKVYYNPDPEERANDIRARRAARKSKAGGDVARRN
ncbi:site-specific integrase [Komagataeibacter saccharivorans]|uniref:tyrosine-type recombinase/integrase n=1 Tax=Komagataeibacter saccharivorans TaxID=265959 RepID=UPI0024A92CB4|nr:site-specific integrase [Komagataeibacter saccharivorans]